MQLASNSALSQPPLAAMPQLSEKPHLGFATKKTAWNPGPNVCNFTVTLGLQVVVSENGVRKTYSARYYNPLTGRFMSRDPQEYTPLKRTGHLDLTGPFEMNGNPPINPKQMHKYLYADGDPVNFIDPLGKSGLEEESDLDSLETYQERSTNDWYRINTQRTFEKLQKVLDDITCLEDCEDLE